MSSQKNFSYFDRHQKIVKNKLQTINKKSNSPKISPKKSNSRIEIQQANESPPIQPTSEPEMSQIFFEKTQEEVMYDEYKQIQKKYELELKNLEQEIEGFKRLAENEVKKIRQAEVGLETKKKELREVKVLYKETIKVAEDEGRLEQNNKVKELKQTLQSLKEKNQQKILQLTEEYEEIVNENNRLEEKLNQMQIQYKKVLEFDPQDYETQKERLIEEQEKLQRELEEVENQGVRLKKDIERIQNVKPVSAQVHRKYLDLYEKMLISKEIAKAEQIMMLKEEERRQKSECERRKEWLREKENQIKIRKKRVESKNQLIESLTNEIKNKSTTLLTMYQTQQQKFKK